MRKFLAAALVLACSTAEAAPLPAAGAMAAVAEATTPVQTVACARYGWRGFGVYPGCFRRPLYAPRYAVVAPVYVPPVYAPPPVYVPPRRCWIDGAWRAC